MCGERCQDTVRRLLAEVQRCQTALRAARRRAAHAEEEAEAHIQRCERQHHSAKAQREVHSFFLRWSLQC